MTEFLISSVSTYLTILCIWVGPLGLFCAQRDVRWGPAARRMAAVIRRIGAALPARPSAEKTKKKGSEKEKRSWRKTSVKTKAFSGCLACSTIFFQE